MNTILYVSALPNLVILGEQKIPIQSLLIVATVRTRGRYSYEAGILKGGTEHVPYLYRQLLFPRSRHEISDMILNG